MRVFTMTCPLRGEQVLLARKHHGRGVGLYKPYGGAVRKGEPLRRAAVRKLKEESSLEAREKDLKYRATVRVYFEGKLLFLFAIFVTRRWKGTPQDSSEMYEAKWFSFGRLPKRNMWRQDLFWLPRILKDGEPFETDVHLDKHGKRVVAAVSTHRGVLTPAAL